MTFWLVLVLRGTCVELAQSIKEPYYNILDASRSHTFGNGTNFAGNGLAQSNAQGDYCGIGRAKMAESIELPVCGGGEWGGPKEARAYTSQEFHLGWV